MESIEDRLSRLRDERTAREKARIEKLRELNLKRYNKSASTEIKKSSTNPIKRPITAPINNPMTDKPKPVLQSKIDIPKVKNYTKAINLKVDKPSHILSQARRPIQVVKPQAKEIKPSTSNKPDLIPTLKPSEEKTKNIKLEAIKSLPNTKLPVNVSRKSLAPNVRQLGLPTKNVASKTDFISRPKTLTEKTLARKSLATMSETLPIKSVSTEKKAIPRKSIANTSDNIKANTTEKPNYLSRKSIAITQNFKTIPRKSMINMPSNKIENKLSGSTITLKGNTGNSMLNPEKESVFERLYKPKVTERKVLSEVDRLRDFNYKNKLLKDAGLVFKNIDKPIRRSFSAVHFKRISKNEIPNCMHKWSSIGEKINKIHLNQVNEDHKTKQEVVSTIKSERKKVKFQTPVPFNLNTPKVSELQLKLKNWLQKRGKSIESFHHLQCFGLHHMRKRMEPKDLYVDDKFAGDDEDKENVALESDSDDDSYKNNMNRKDDLCAGDNMDKWRRASYISDSPVSGLNETCNTSLTSGETMTVHHVDELLTGALNDLTELLREGFDWEQCARWLRAVREQFPLAPETAAYWECRAALEERRGDLPASVSCWEEAIAKGTERSVVEANLDQLLDKFMQLKISSTNARRTADPKMVDVKNVFKSTIIRFAVQQAKLRKSGIQEPPKYTVTPVRRSGRLSVRYDRTPLQICSSVKQAQERAQPLLFVPNDQLAGTP